MNKPIIPILTLASCYCSCTSSSNRQPSAINDSTVANATYFMPYMVNLCDTIKLTSGSWEKEEAIDSEMIDRQSMDIYKVAYGDLNEDSKIDAAVVLSQWTGGSGIFISINALIDSNGVPFHRACTYIGDRIRVDSICVKNQIIVI